MDYILTLFVPLFFILGWYFSCKVYNKWVRSYVWKAIKRFFNQNKRDY